MSDCSANAWAVPKACVPAGLGDAELVIDTLVPAADLACVRTVRIRQLPDEVFVRRDTCELTVEYEGYPCSDFRCSACGKVHNAPAPQPFCPRCAAEVVGVSFEGVDGDQDPGRGKWDGVEWHEPGGGYEESYEWMNDD